MCKRGGLLIAYDMTTKRALVTDADCDSWKCPECSERLRERWILRASIGATEFLSERVPLDFVTITSHERLKDFAATETVWRDAWSKLYAALKRKAAIFEYLIVPEKHKDGRMHVHALWTAGVSKRWLKDNARSRGLGYQAEVIHVLEAWHAVKYVTKYIGKALGDDAPPHFRRVRVSRGWAEIPVPETPEAHLEFHYIGSNGALQTAYEHCKAERLTMIDLRTGEMFDDEDLGTIVAG